MKPHCFNPVPVSLSIVVLCDLRVLIQWTDGESSRVSHFPYCYFGDPNDPATFYSKSREPRKGLEECAFGILNEAFCDGLECEVSWLPVDVRSNWARTNPDMEYSVDIGYLTILNASDLPFLNDGFTWEIVNLEENRPPCKIASDHSALWDAAKNMFNIMK